MSNPGIKPNSLYSRLGIVLGLYFIYFLAFPALYREFSSTAISLGIIPVAASGWFFGIWSGASASLITIFINAIILTGMNPQVSLQIGEIWLDFILLIPTGLSTGYLHKSLEDRNLIEEELQQRLREERALSDISLALSETERVGLNHVLQLIVDSARELLPDTEQAVIHLLDVEHQVLVPQAVSGFENPSAGKLNMRMGEGVAGQVIETGEMVNISDVETDIRFLPNKNLVRFRSLMVAPVESGEKRLGTISVQSGKPNAFLSTQQFLLKSLGTQAAIAIENARLLETTQQGFKEVNALYHVTQGLSASLETDQLMKDVVNLLQENFGYYHAAILVIDPETEDLVVRHGSGKPGEEMKNGRLKAGAGIIGQAAATGEPFFTNAVDEVVFYVPHPLLPLTQSELSMPIKVNNRVLGVLDVQQCPPGKLTNRDMQLVSTVAEQLSVALQKAELYSNLQTSLLQEKSMRSQLIQSERLALVGRLLASVSHELNNPLQAIHNALFLLKEERGISAQGQQDLQIVLAEAERMAALIDRLRTSYRPTRKEDFQTIQLNNVVEDIHTLVSTHLRHNRIAFEFHPDPYLPLVLGLPDQLRQVVLNLLMNAVEVMPEGGRVNVTTEWAGGNEVSVSVSDTGPGINPEILPNIFDAFVTNKEGGTGLGLTITYDIVHRHNGRILAQNAPEGGATFTFWIPTARDETK
jgi:signal transduction histidine kinase